MTLERWRGLKSIAQAAVEQGSRAIESVQKQAARRPFAVLEALPPLAALARSIHGVHDASVAGVHGAMRLVTRLVGLALDVALDMARDDRAASRGR